MIVWIKIYNQCLRRELERESHVNLWEFEQ